MSKFKRIICGTALVTILLFVLTFIGAIPGLKSLFYAPGPIYYSQSDQNLKTVLNNSNIIESLTNYKFYILKSALGLKLKEGNYRGSRNLKFFKTKMYISLLEDILSRNDDQIEYHINKKDKKVFIWPKNQFEQF